MLKTALIVDDSRLARLTLKRLLAKYDIEVAEAESVVDGENWIARHTLPDIVFMDIMMPDIDGYEGLARLRADPDTHDLPVIMYSGDISEDARRRSHRLPAQTRRRQPLGPLALRAARPRPCCPCAATRTSARARTAARCPAACRTGQPTLGDR